MLLLDFFKKESDVPKGPIIFMGIMSGIANSLVLGVINQGAQKVSNNEEVTQLFFIFLISVALFIYTRKYSLSQATIMVEQAIRRVRVRITDKIRRTELSYIEKHDRAQIYTHLTQDANLISQSGLVVVSGIQSVVVIIFCSLYVAMLSPMGFLIIAVGFTAAALLYLSHSKAISQEIHLSILKEAEFFAILNHVLDGFKEIRINSRKSDDVFRHVEKISVETEQVKISTGLKFVTDIMFSRVFSNSLLGIVVFIMPLFSPTHATIVIKITATVLFLISPIEVIVGAIPMFARATASIENITKLEESLDEVLRQNPHSQSDEADVDKNATMFSRFQHIEFQQINFQYTDKTGAPSFRVGPIDLTINREEILFIVGGNGSGKSTFLKLLTGLYYPLSGSIAIDGEELDYTNYQAHRELFSIIFTDFHLFDRLYGLQHVDEKRVKSLLQMMELDKKTKYTHGQFSQLDLSTGQKKRLAFIAAVMEDKPIYIFDELAADQDPQFRKHFYEEILPDLRRQGKTIIAVTHDDNYFHCADRVLKMELGELRPITEINDSSV
ncbi:MAG: cyclic peptide export ABC transporter [Thiotrichaceae bacterium]